MKIATANSTGWMEGTHGDGIVLNFLGRARGTVRYGQAPTIQCDGGGSSGVITMNDKLTIRKLTETECLRLMGFDDDEIGRLKAATNDKGKPTFSRSALYQFAGNSVVVDCYKAIQETILEDMENEGKPRPGTLEAWM